MVIDMERTVYAIQKEFSSYLQKHPAFLACIKEFSLEQQKKFLLPIQEEEIKERAIAYFDEPSIYLKDHTLYYEHPLRAVTYKIKIEALCITIYEQEGNPFFPFLKRIYRELLSYPNGFQEQSDIKVL